MPLFSLTQPLTLSELAAALRSREALRLPATPVGHTETSSLGPAPALDQPSPAAASAAPETSPASWLLAHTCGTGAEVPAELVRRMLLLQAHGLSRDKEQAATAKRLLDFYNRDVWPVVYEHGALGTAHDAVPLAHLALPLLGLGEVNYQGYRLAAADVLELFGWAPLALAPSAGQALLGGQQFRLAYATATLERAAHLLRAARAIGALGTGVSEPPSPELVAAAEAAYRAAQAALTQAQPVVEAACNAVNSSYPETSTTSQSFENQLLNLTPTLGKLALAVAAVGSQGGQQAALLAATLPQAPEPGLVALPSLAASLTSQNQQLCQIFSNQAADNQNNTTEFGALAATTAYRVVENTEQLLGLALLVAAQAHEARLPAHRSAAPEAVVAAFRAHITFVAHRVLTPDLHRAARFVREHGWE